MPTLPRVSLTGFPCRVTRAQGIQLASMSSSPEAPVPAAATGSVSWPEILQRYVAGNRLEQAESYLVLRRLVRRGLGHRMTALGSDADDFIHERLMEIAQLYCRGEIREDRSFPAFVITVVRNRFIDWARVTKRVVLTEAEIRQEIDDNPVDSETQQAVRKALETLPDEQRQVVVSIVVERRTLADTGTRLGLTMGEVRGRLHRALTAMRVLLTERIP